MLNKSCVFFYFLKINMLESRCVVIIITIDSLHCVVCVILFATKRET